MYIYFRYNGGGGDLQNLYVDGCYQLRCCRPRLDNWHNIFWSLWSVLSFRTPKFVEYQYLFDGKVVARAQVIHKLPIFRFMDNMGVHIGPCCTDPMHRGKNLYPSLLTRILSDHIDRNVYIFTDDANKASLRGIEKAGFVPFAVGNRRFKFYVVEKYL